MYLIFILDKWWTKDKNRWFQMVPEDFGFPGVYYNCEINDQNKGCVIYLQDCKMIN